MESKPKILRITTVPISLKILLNGQLSFFKSHGFEVLAVSADGKEVQSLIQEGITHQCVPMTRKITPFKDLLCLFRLISIIWQFKPDIIHTHTPKAGLLGMLAGWICNVKVRLHTVAGLPLMETTGLTKMLLLLTEKITYWCATRVYPNSSGLKQFIQQHIFDSPKLRIIGKGSSNGINTDLFSPIEDVKKAARDIRIRYGISDNDVVYSFVGRIVKDKGISEIVTAFKSLLTEQNNAKKQILLLIGPFEQDLDPISLNDFKFLHEHPQVILAGFQKDVRPWIYASDIFVFPSYREGFPNVVMQACCLEKPCIVSDINGCNEIIQNHETGLIIPAKDHHSLVKVMRSLSEDRNLRQQFALKARKYVVANFDQQYVWNELLKEYQFLLTKKAKSNTFVRSE